ncbi:MAG: hypothetical protein J2O44_03170 [Porphyrobacter sp.]|nr:hypothetical protein [Porphyrobacter sp.]
MNEAAPLPALGFGVGIVGHRANRIDDAEKVRGLILQIVEVVDGALDEAAAGGFYPVGRRPLRLVSALAEGADRLAASAAIDAGVRLEVVLPFVAAEYRKDFANQASCDEFDRLLDRAETVLVLDGKADERQRAYEAAGMTLLDNCDLLIAVWDGGPGRGRGGTREVIEEATRRAIPVIVIDPAGNAATVRSGGPGAGPMRLEDVPELALAELPSLIFAEVGVTEGPASAAEWLRLAEPPPEPMIHSAYPLLLKLAGIRSWRTPRPVAADEAPRETSIQPVRQAFAWWDQVAIRAAQAFRSAVIVNFALAALAVVLAATSLLAQDAKWLFVLAEVITILLLLANTVSAGRRRWQERWLEARQVAELLRVCTLLRNVGIGRGIADPGQGGLLGWYAGAFARSVSLERLDLSDPRAAAAPLIAEVRSQAQWNEATARRMHLAARRIERFGEALFAVVLLAAIGWLLLDIVVPSTAYELRYVLTAVTAGLPAIATASYGIRVILDFEGIAQRSGRIAAGLHASLAKWEAEVPSAARLQEFARRAADIMLGDIAAWRLLAEGRRLTLPG